MVHHVMNTHEYQTNQPPLETSFSTSVCPS